jgi:protease II
MAALVGTNGAQPELAIWLTPKHTVGTHAAAWTQVVSHNDGVTAFTLWGDTLVFISNRDAPTFKVLTLQVGESLSAAKTLVPARKDHIIAAVYAGSDALYIEKRVGLYSHLLRVARGTTSVTEIPLPGRGSVWDLLMLTLTSPDISGIVGIDPRDCLQEPVCLRIGYRGVALVL